MEVAIVGNKSDLDDVQVNPHKARHVRFNALYMCLVKMFER